MLYGLDSNGDSLVTGGRVMNDKIRTEEREVVVEEVVKRRTKKSVYITTDDRVFLTIRSADDHQAQLDKEEAKRLAEERWGQVKRLDNDYANFFDGEMWYYAANEEDLELIKTKLGYYAPYSYRQVFAIGDELMVGDWICMGYEERDRSRDIYRFFTHEYVVKEMREFMERFGKVAQE